AAVRAAAGSRTRAAAHRTAGPAEAAGPGAAPAGAAASREVRSRRTADPAALRSRPEAAGWAAESSARSPFLTDFSPRPEVAMNPESYSDVSHTDGPFLSPG